MRRSMTWGVTLAALVACGGPMALAAEHGGSTSARPAAASRPSAVAAPQLMSAEGSISTVDLQANTVTLTNVATGKTWTFTLDKASVSRAGLPATTADLKAGAQARVRYAAQVGKLVARSIEIKSAAQ